MQGRQPASIESHPFHEATSIFPLMNADEFACLVADINQHKQQEKIVLHQDGRILDGRNRFKACKQLGIEPKDLVLGKWISREGRDLKQRVLIGSPASGDLWACSARFEGFPAGLGGP